MSDYAAAWLELYEEALEKFGMTPPDAAMYADDLVDMEWPGGDDADA